MLPTARPFTVRRHGNRNYNEHDIRTIERQLEALSVHFEIERDETSKPYRYCWNVQDKGISLPTLTAQECLLLTLAEQQLGHLLPPRLMKSMSAFFSPLSLQEEEEHLSHVDKKKTHYIIRYVL